MRSDGTDACALHTLIALNLPLSSSRCQIQFCVLQSELHVPCGLTYFILLSSYIDLSLSRILFVAFPPGMRALNTWTFCSSSGVSCGSSKIFLKWQKIASVLGDSLCQSSLALITSKDLEALDKCGQITNWS